MDAGIGDGEKTTPTAATMSVTTNPLMTCTITPSYVAFSDQPRRSAFVNLISLTTRRPASRRESWTTIGITSFR